MLFASLILSGILLLIACTGRTGVATAFGFGFIGLGFLAGVIFPGFVLSVFIVPVVYEVWRILGWRRPWAGPVALAGVVAAHGLVSLLSLGTLREEAELRAQYPYESMEQRLPREPARAEALPVLTLARLSRMEEAIDWEAEVSQVRVYKLKQLHEDQVGLFANSPGFGVGRFLRPSVGSLGIWNERRPISQAGEVLVWSPGEFEVQGEFATNEGLINMHDKGVVDFAYPAGFGYAKDRRHVAGFISHQFAQAPETEHWQLQRLDLVGLLLHEQPVAYVSEHLPRMDELREAPTRELDLFEAVGLQALRQGEDLFVRGTEEKVRMLGALRAAKQCVTCHGGQRGDLLGAFSYTLRRAQP